MENITKEEAEEIVSFINSDGWTLKLLFDKDPMLSKDQIKTIHRGMYRIIKSFGVPLQDSVIDDMTVDKVIYNTEDSILIITIKK